MKVGTKVQIFEGGEGEVVEIRGREALARWHASGAVSSCAELTDLVVAEWIRDPRCLPENPA